MAHPFIVGERYLDRHGEYTVLRIEGNRIVFCYEDGVERTGDIEIRARAHKNILGEQRATHPYQTSGYFFTLGFLARKSEFQAEVPPQSQANFEEEYRLNTGRTPALHEDGYYPIDILTPYDKWAPELRIYFPPEDQPLEFPPGIELRDGNKPGLLRINNNGFWRQLVRLGFRLGREHDIQRIRQGIPAACLDDFERGYST